MSTSRPSAASPSALLLAPEAPYPMAGGGAIRTASVVEYLAPRYALDLIVFREPGAALRLPERLFRNVDVIDLPFHRRSFLARAARNLKRYVRGRPPLNDRFDGFAASIAAVLAGRRYDVAILEHFWCAPYCEQVRRHAKRVILDLHNVESVLHARCADAEPWPASALFRRFARSCARMERAWLPRFDDLLVASEADAARLGGRAHVFPNAIPHRPLPEVAQASACAIVFSGNLEYQPNISAVRFFRREIWPLLRDRRPDLVWRLVGRNAHAVERYTAGDERIQVQGAVDDAVAALAEASVVVAPLLAGSGTRLKILEAWAAGRAVVSTSLGAEGLDARDGEHLLLADTPRAFADAVCRLLESPETRVNLGCAGRRLYEERFTWPRAWSRLSAIGV